MTTTKRQRIISAVYRLHTTTGDEQHRAFDRLCQLADFTTAFGAWLTTKPHPAHVEMVVNNVLLVSPLRPMIRSKV